MPAISVEQRDQGVRRKVALACQICRERKTRCDGAKPMCGGCQRRQYTQDQCIYASIENARSASGKEYIRLLHERIRTLESRIPNPHSPPSSVRATSVIVDTSSISLSGGEGQGSNANLVSPPRRTRQVFNNTQSYQYRKNATFSNPRIASGFTEGRYQQPQFESGFAGTHTSKTSGSAEPLNTTSTRLASTAQFQSQSAHSPYLRNEVDNIETSPSRLVSPDLLSTISGVPIPQIPDHESPINAMGTALALPDEAPSPREKFYGTSSAVSFLCQIRDTVNQHSGKSEPSRHYGSNRRPRQAIHPLYTLSNDVSSSQLEHYYLPPRPLADHLLNCYWERVHCLYPFVHKVTFMSAYNQLWLAEQEENPSTAHSDAGLGGVECSDSVFYCALNAMLALGCQLSEMKSEKRESLAAAFFRRSMDLIHINILDEGNLALLQTLLIVAQYLQSTQLPSRCWNIIGLAVRVAQGLGLYSDKATRPVHGRGFLEIEMRRRAWHGCITLDMVVSMTLGRPPMIHSGSMVPLPLAIDDEYIDQETTSYSQPSEIFSQTAFFIETIKLYNILGQVLTKIYKPYNETDDCERNNGDKIPNNGSTETIVAIDSAMNELEAKLPWALHWNRPSSIVGAAAEVFERQTNVLHARFLHLRILLYRPTLNQLCRSFHLGSLQSTSFATSPNRALENGSEAPASEFAVFCSITCIEAAQDLIKLINQYSQTSATGAWWYNIFYLSTSAMVLILAEIWKPASTTLSEKSLTSSWQQCLDALARIASSNNAAKECAKILIAMRQRVTFSNGISGFSTNESGVSANEFQADEDGPTNWMDFDLQSDVDLTDILCRDPGLLPPWNLEDTMSWQLPTYNSNLY